MSAALRGYIANTLDRGTKLVRRHRKRAGSPVINNTSQTAVHRRVVLQRMSAPQVEMEATMERHEMRVSTAGPAIKTRHPVMVRQKVCGHLSAWAQGRRADGALGVGLSLGRRLN